MKWLAAGVAIALAYALGRWLRRSARGLEWATTALAVLPFVLGAHDYFALNPISLEHYRGDANGLELTIVDVLALALWVALPRARRPAPWRAARFAYLGIATATVLWAPLPVFTLLSAWRLARGFFVFAVVARACETPRLGNALVNGLAIGILVSCAEALYQRYGLHMHQCRGFFPHQNGLGMAVEMVFPIALAVLLAGQGGKLAAATLAASAVAVILTLSRASLAVFAGAMTVVFAGSLLRGLTVRKIQAAAGTAVVAIALVGYSFGTIAERFESAPRSSFASRGLFDDAAMAMLADHPMGIGLNQYSHVLEHGGYADRFHIDPVDRSGLAHDLYWLTAAETGWLGIAAFLFMLSLPLLTAARAVWRVRGDIRAEVVFGAAVGLAAVYVHWLAEWGARTAELTYLYWTLAGLIATLSAQLDPAARAMQRHDRAETTP